MILDINQGDKWADRNNRGNIEFHEDNGYHELSNGGVGVIDDDGSLVAYNKNGAPDGNDWDYVRKDFRK